MAPLVVQVVTVAGQRHRVELPDGGEVAGAALYSAAGEKLQMHPGRFKLLLRGAPLPAGAADTIKLSEGDALVVVPQRRAPTEAAAAAAAEAMGVAPPDDDDEAVRFRLPPGAPAWHAALARFLQRTLGAPDLALAWLFAVGPGRLAVFLAVLAGARVASGYGLGSLYLMAAILAALWTNLGERREGEASAYSIFNPGVRRLPGQLDADTLDEQLRRGGGM